MDARSQAFFDQYEAHVASMIRQHGWFIQYVGGSVCSFPDCDCPDDPDEPPFAYTTGLFGLGHAELLVFGVSPEHASTILNGLGHRVRGGEALLPGVVTGVEGFPHRIIPEVVPNPGDIVFAANDFYQRPAESSVPVLQLSYDDADGRFPWEDGCADPSLQPRPGTFAA